MALFSYPLLAIDTSMNACSVAVKTANGKVISQSPPMPRGHAEALIPLIQSICEEAGITLQDIECFLVTRGPGAFAGLRVGLATATTLARSANKPVYAVETPAILHHQFGKKDPVCIVMESKRKDFYIQCFDADGEAEGTPRCAMPDQITALADQYWLAGDGVERLLAEHPQLSNRAQVIPHLNPKAMIDYCEKNTDKQKLNDISPLYCKEADVSSPRITIKVE